MCVHSRIYITTPPSLPLTTSIPTTDHRFLPELIHFYRQSLSACLFLPAAPAAAALRPDASPFTDLAKFCAAHDDVMLKASTGTAHRIGGEGQASHYTLLLSVVGLSSDNDDGGGGGGDGRQLTGICCFTLLILRHLTQINPTQRSPNPIDVASLQSFDPPSSPTSTYPYPYPYLPLTLTLNLT